MNCGVIQVYEVLYLSGDEFVWSGRGDAQTQQQPSEPPNEPCSQRVRESDAQALAVPGPMARQASCGTVANALETEVRRDQARGADLGCEPLLSADYDDALTTSEACIRMWIAAVLIDKERGDRLTDGECAILSLLGLEPSWAQRMIDRAPSPGRVCRPRFT